MPKNPTTSKVSDNLIAKYKDIYFNTHGSRPSKNKARTESLALMRIVKIQEQEAQPN